MKLDWRVQEHCPNSTTDIREGLQEASSRKSAWNFDLTFILCSNMCVVNHVQPFNWNGKQQRIMTIHVPNIAGVYVYRYSIMTLFRVMVDCRSSEALLNRESNYGIWVVLFALCRNVWKCEEIIHQLRELCRVADGRELIHTQSCFYTQALTRWRSNWPHIRNTHFLGPMFQQFGYSFCGWGSEHMPLCDI